MEPVLATLLGTELGARLLNPAPGADLVAVDQEGHIQRRRLNSMQQNYVASCGSTSGTGRLLETGYRL